MTFDHTTIPVVNFEAWSHGSSDERRRIAQQLTDACRRVGFVYVVNHGISSELIEEAFQFSKKLFDLPQEKKMLAPHPPGRCSSSQPTCRRRLLIGVKVPMCTEDIPGLAVSTRFLNLRIAL